MKRVHIGAYVEPEFKEKLDEAASTRGMTISELVRRAVKAYVQSPNLAGLEEIKRDIDDAINFTELVLAFGSDGCLSYVKRPKEPPTQDKAQPLRV